MRRSLALLTVLGIAALARPAVVAAAPAADDTVAVWVRFVDRGALAHASEAARRQAALAQLSPRSLERRARRGVLHDVTESDLPVDPGYVNALRARGFRVRAVSRWLNAASVAAPRARLAELAALPFAAAVDPVPRYWRPRIEVDEPQDVIGVWPPGPAGAQAVAAPGDPDFYGYSYAQNHIIQADQLHALGLTGQGVLVTMLDTGFRETHLALRGLDVIARRDFVNGDTIVVNEAGDRSDQDEHGTWTLSSLAGYEPGVLVGTGYGVTLALGKTEDVTQERPIEMDWWQMGAEWADSLGADVISSSLGYFTFDSAYSSFNYTYADMDGRTTVVTLAAVEAMRRGITVVTAVGNEGTDPWKYLIAPSDGDTVCAVGAVDSLNVIAAFSSYGPTADGRVKPDVCAMGVRSSLAGPYNDTTIVQHSGTSFATPETAGLVALLLQAHPGWGPYEVIEALRSTADRASNPDPHYGYGTARGPLALQWTTDSSGAPGTGRLAFLGTNPVAGAAVLRFTLRGGAAGGAAALDVYDVRGRRVRALWRETLPAGVSRGVSWNLTDDGGRRVAGGIYFVRFTAPGVERTARLVVLS